MRQRMKKFCVCFLAALAVLVSVLSVPGVAYADDRVPTVVVNSYELVNFRLPYDPDEHLFGLLEVGSCDFNLSSSDRYLVSISLDGNIIEFVPQKVLYIETELEEDGLLMPVKMFSLSQYDLGGDEVGGYNVNIMSAVTPGGDMYRIDVLYGSNDFDTAPDFTEESELFVSVFSYDVANSGDLGSNVAEEIPAWSNGQFTNQSMVEFFEKPAFIYGDRAPVPSLVDSPTGMYKITYNGVDYIVTSFTETNADGALMVGFNTDDGTTVGVMVDSTQVTSGIIRSYFFLNVDYVEGETLTMTTYNPPRADLPTFLESSGNFITWLITTFGAILAFMLSNPISFIWIIVSLVVVVVKILQNTAEN